MAKVQIISKEQLREFYKYFNEFYGPGGVYDKNRTITEDELLQAVEKRLEQRPDLPFEGDTADRELVREILFPRQKTEAREPSNAKDIKIVKKAADKLGLGDRSDITEKDKVALQEELLKGLNFELAKYIGDLGSAAELEDLLVNIIYG